MTNNRKASLLLIYTGGTIGMKVNPEDGTLHPFDFSQILDEVPELGKFAYRLDSFSFDPIIDSSDVEPAIWQDLARIIKDNYDSYDGFVVLHGTDTMAYSASALSFILENLAKPVIFTGSQLPIGEARTDGKENLISAVEIAASLDVQGHPRVPEVCIFFDNKLMRGNRTTKYSSDNFNAFSSPNLAPLAEAGITIRYNDGIIRKPSEWNVPLKINLNLDTRVGILKIHPGITPEVVGDVLCGNSTRAVILETYGSGNAPSKSWFLDVVHRAAQSKILLNVTQCFSGAVDMGIYSNGKALQNAGVVSGQDLTTESALAKLFHLMGNCSDNKEVKRLIQENLRGEI
ncbi:MAG: type I asparaginase [Bacteroidales bacterium]|nr:type I asparaginase [Bacteroidales bacterium]